MSSMPMPAASSSSSSLSSSSRSSQGSSSSSSLFSEDEAKFMSQSFHEANQFDPFTLGAPGFKVPSHLPIQRSISPTSTPTSTSAQGINQNLYHTRFSSLSSSSPSGSYLASAGVSGGNRFSSNEMMPPHHLTKTNSNSSNNSSENPNTSTTSTMTSTPFYSADVDHHRSPNSVSSANSTSPPQHHSHSFHSIHARHNSLGSAAWHNPQQNYNQPPPHPHPPHQGQLDFQNNQNSSSSWYNPNQNSSLYPSPSSAPPQPPSAAYGSQWAMEQLNFLQSESQKFSSRPRAESASSHSNSAHSSDAGDSNPMGMAGGQQQQQGGTAATHNGNGHGNRSGTVGPGPFSQSLQIPSMSDDHHRRHSLAGYVNSTNHHQFPTSSAPPPTSSSATSFDSGFIGDAGSNGMDIITPQITPQPTGNGGTFKSSPSSKSNSNANGSQKDLSMLGLSFPSSHTFPSINHQPSPFSKRQRNATNDVDMRDNFGENKRGRSSTAEGSHSGPSSWANTNNASFNNFSSSTGMNHASKTDPSKSPTKQSSNFTPQYQANPNAQDTSSSSSTTMPTSWSLMSYSASDPNSFSLQGSESLRPIAIDPERGRGLIPTELEEHFWTRRFDKKQPHLEDLKRKELAKNGGNLNAISSQNSSKGKGRASSSSNDKEKEKEKPALLTEAEKKANHIASEQKRRANIRKGYEMLCNIIPPLREALEREKSNGGGRRGGMAFTGMVNVNSNSVNDKKDSTSSSASANQNNDDNDDEDGDGNGKKSKDDDGDGLEIEGEKIDGRAGPRSEGIVLMKSVEYLRQELERHRSLLARRSHAQVKVAKLYGADIILPEGGAEKSTSTLNQSKSSGSSTGKNSANKGKGNAGTNKNSKSKTNPKKSSISTTSKDNSTRNTRRNKPVETQEKEQEQGDQDEVEEGDGNDNDNEEGHERVIKQEDQDEIMDH